ncbi:HD-GYP domain-containing protein [Egibacter rhizosphaerae]|uniref:HD-GYP domain-containing protein n=1 Tax=Egibacter rhizosphaerae TaxID=1670831 RepID=A0A411YC72_9ACTN|nr:HD-GYP domain-containing protein [Egibacter rhizosphaerae]QBI18747.1 HD-GYP domain-containing protein [Egibacter rhizosphaerae]
MYACSTDRLEPGMVVARPLLDERGEILLQTGTTLTVDYITRLRRRGITAVEVRDGLADDVPPVTLISGHLRTAATRNVARVFEAVSSMSRDLFGPNPPITGVQQALDRLGDRPLPLPPQGTEAVVRLYQDIELLIAELLDGVTVASLESLKTHHGDTFTHSVDVAVISLVLGHEARLPHAQLRELGLGALLHDLGKMYVDERVLAKPGPLTEDELNQVRQHPSMGFELVRRMPVFSLVPAHVAYQHHERQDGGGYPRGLEGNNRIDRQLQERIDSRRMLLMAEIAAVADVYSAVTSDRPHRRAYPPDQAIDLMEAHAGAQLNREVVELLTRNLPRYPIGHWVEVTAGAWSGWRGVVLAVPSYSLNQPVVRLLLDAAHEPVDDGVEVDLREDPHTRIACMTEEGLPDLAPDRQRLALR